MVMQRDHSQGVRRPFLKPRHRVCQSFVGERAALLAPRANRVEPDDHDPVGSVQRLGRPEDALPFRERPGETRRQGERDVVVTGHRQKGQSEPSKKLRCRLELTTPPAVRQVSCCDEHLRLQIGDELT